MNDHEQRQAQDENVMALKKRISTILGEALLGDNDRYALRHGNGYAIRWGLVEKAIHEAIDQKQAQDEADLALGRLVRQMPENALLWHGSFGWAVFTGVKQNQTAQYLLTWTGAPDISEAHVNVISWDKPEDVLKLAGIGQERERGSL